MTEDKDSSNNNNNGGFEAFLKKKEKNLLKSMFATSDDEDSCPSSSTSSPSRSRSNSHSDEDDENDNNNTIFQFSKLSCTDESQPSSTSIESNILIYQNKLVPELQIHIQERKQLGIAHQLWPAAGYLTEYFLEHLDQILPIVNPSIKEEPSSLPLTVNCIELGAGLGLTGIFLSKYFQSHSQLNISQMMLTDLPEALDGLHQNIQLNPTNTTNTDTSIPSISAMELSWGQDTKQIDHIFQSFSNISIPTIIIAADVIYWECLFLPLIESISYLCHTYQCKIFIAHIKRWKKDQKFLLLAKKHKLIVNILQENITMEIHEHTKQLEKQIKRIYCISAMK